MSTCSNDLNLKRTQEVEALINNMIFSPRHFYTCTNDPLTKAGALWAKEDPLTRVENECVAQFPALLLSSSQPKNVRVKILPANGIKEIGIGVVTEVAFL